MNKVHQPAREMWLTRLIWLACTVSLLSILRYQGFEGWWYKIGTVMHHPEASAISGRRRMFPFLAVQLQHLVPSLSDLDCYFATQIVVIAATVYVVGEWAKLFVPRLGRIYGYVALTLMLGPTMRYWTFYDTAIVGFWACCLVLLLRRKYAMYLAVFALATLNHENNVLLVPVTALFLWRRLPARGYVGLLTAQLAIYGAVRYLTAMMIPAAAIVELGLWDNLLFWKKYSLQALALSAGVVIPWWALAWMGFRTAPQLVRCSAISFPLLFLVTTLFGRYEEARQFVACIPSCIALIGCALTRELSGDEI